MRERQLERGMTANFFFITCDEVADVCAVECLQPERVAEPRDVFGIVDVTVYVEIGVHGCAAEYAGSIALERGQARRQVNRRGQIAVIRKTEIDALRADDAALAGIEHDPECARRGERRAVLKGKDMIARAEETVHLPGPCRVDNGFALTRRAQGADMDTGKGEEQTAVLHGGITCAESDGVAFAALLHGDKKRIKAHASVEITISRADGKGFRIGLLHGKPPYMLWILLIESVLCERLENDPLRIGEEAGNSADSLKA